MHLTFIGHQTWLASAGDAHVLIDPLLAECFSHSDSWGIEIYPPRTVDTAAMPVPTAVVLTHEHSDHFHLPSLARLPRHVPVVVGPTMIQPIVDAIAALGLMVLRQPLLEPLRLGRLEVTLFGAAPSTVFWESRVTQVLVRDADQPGSGGAFIAVDALVSPSYARSLAAGERPAPSVIALSNNSQITPPRVFGALDNLTAAEDPNKHGPVGLRILHELLLDYTKDLPPIPNVLICGGGFMKDYDALGPFPFSDQDELAAVGDQLLLDTRVRGLLPGEAYDVDTAEVRRDMAPWIALDGPRLAALKHKRDAFLADPHPIAVKPLCGRFASDDDAWAAVREVEAELAGLARALMCSRVGQAALDLEQHHGEPLDGRRIVLVLCDGPGGRPLRWALDLNRAAFVRDDGPDDRVLERFPFGLELFLIDYVNVLRGEIQIWDLAGIAMRSWYMGDRLASLVSFMYSYYGELVRPDLARGIYMRTVSRLGQEPGSVEVCDV